MRPFGYHRAQDPGDALAALARPGARLLGGGTDLLREMKSRLEAPAELVDVSRVAAWSGLRVSARDGLRAGGAARLADLELDPAVCARYPLLAQALGGIATPQIRNRATLAGSLLQRPACPYYREGLDCFVRDGSPCGAAAGDNRRGGIFSAGSPCVAGHPSDSAVALLALDAEVVLAAAPAARRSRGPARPGRGLKRAPLASLYALPDARDRREVRLAPGTAIVEVRVPPPRRGSRGAFLRARERATWAFALVAVAAHAVVEPSGRVADIRIVAGGVAPIPWRLRAVEDGVRGVALDATAARRAAARATLEAHPLATSAYKAPLLEALVERALLAIAAPSPPGTGPASPRD